MRGDGRGGGGGRIRRWGSPGARGRSGQELTRSGAVPLMFPRRCALSHPRGSVPLGAPRRALHPVTPAPPLPSHPLFPRPSPPSFPRCSVCRPLRGEGLKAG
eukprot:6957940-Pyramimonas_sp.AAC.1